MEFAHGDPADQNAFEVQVFGDNPTAQGEDRVDVRPALKGSDDGIVVVVQNLHLFPIVPSGLPHPVVGLRCPLGAVVAEDESDGGDVAIENQRANLRNRRCDSRVQRDFPLGIEQHPDGPERGLQSVLGEVRGAAQVLDLVLALENRHQEVAFLDVVDIQTVHPGVVAAFGQQRDAVIERQIEGRGHAQNDERRGFALVLVRPREPFRVGFDDARDPEIDDAGVDVRGLAPLRSRSAAGRPLPVVRTVPPAPRIVTFDAAEDMDISRCPGACRDPPLSRRERGRG